MSFPDPDDIFQCDPRETAAILRHGPYALKMPKIRPCDSENVDENRQTEFYQGRSRRELANEEEVYRRLGQHDGIAQCINISADGTLLALYKRGTLEAYIKCENEVTPAMKTKWILSLITTHLHFHTANVFVIDLSLRNILLADDLSLKMIDFGKCRLLPKDMNIDMDRINDKGMSARVEMHHLGSVIYSIASWTNYEWDYCSIKKELPAVGKLPDVSDVFCGDVIWKCWAGGYQAVQYLYEEAFERLAIIRIDGS